MEKHGGEIAGKPYQKFIQEKNTKYRRTMKTKTTEIVI